MQRRSEASALRGAEKWEPLTFPFRKPIPCRHRGARAESCLLRSFTDTYIHSAQRADLRSPYSPRLLSFYMMPASSPVYSAFCRHSRPFFFSRSTFFFPSPLYERSYMCACYVYTYILADLAPQNLVSTRNSSFSIPCFFVYLLILSISALFINIAGRKVCIRRAKQWRHKLAEKISLNTN